MPTIKCRINGRATTVTAWDPQQPLLYALRALPGKPLRGAKIGCGLGQCGTCTVLVDAEPVKACVVPIGGMAGRSITTIEGVGTASQPDPVQAAFIAEQAAQCGYCTPGMVMAAKALLARTPRPTVEQVKAALAGNLCRCGAHTRIVDAVLRAADTIAASRAAKVKRA